MRALPALLGALVLSAGVIAFTRSHAPTVTPPETVTLEPLPTEVFRAVLIQQADGEVRTREALLRAADAAPARLTATLRALRGWLLREELWPRELGAPRVFWLPEERVALDFPLGANPRLAVSTELYLLESIRQTAVRGGARDVFILVNGRVPPTFLGQVALPGTLEE